MGLFLICIQNSEKVILIFSVNASSHFQGYAQMISPIGNDRSDDWNTKSERFSGNLTGNFKVKWLSTYDN